MRKIFLPSLVAVLALAGCSGGTTDEASDTTQNADQVDVQADVEEMPSGPVAYSEVDMGFLDAMDVYSEFTFESGSGDCVDQGFFSEFKFVEVPEGGFVVRDADETYEDDFAVASAFGTLGFDEVPIGDQVADCVADIPYQEDISTVTCTVDDVEICTADFNLVARP